MTRAILTAEDGDNRNWHIRFSIMRRVHPLDAATDEGCCALRLSVETSGSHTETFPPRHSVLTPYPMIFRSAYYGGVNVPVLLNTTH